MISEKVRQTRNAYMRAYRKRQSDAQKEKNKEWQETYRDKNRNLINQRNKNRYEDNPNTQAARSARCAEKNPERTLWYGAKRRAKDFAIDFNLEVSDIVIPEKCPYLKCVLKVLRGKGSRWDAPSVDRIDPSKGYVKGNIEVISRKANIMKSNASKEELLSFSHEILKRYDE